MVDPFTFLGSIGALVGVVARIATDLTSFAASTKDVPGKIEQLSQQVNAFRAVVLQLQQRFQARDHGYATD